MTFSLHLSPFSALEFVARNSEVALIFEEGVWHMRPFDDTQLVTRAYKVQSFAAKRDKANHDSNIVDDLIESIAEFAHLIESIKEVVGIPIKDPEPSARDRATIGGTAVAKAATGEVLWNPDDQSLQVTATRQQHQWVEGYVDSFNKPQALIAIRVHFFYEPSRDQINNIGDGLPGAMAGGYDFSQSGLELSDLKFDRTAAPKTAIFDADDLTRCINALLAGTGRRPNAISYPPVFTRHNREVSIQSVVREPFLIVNSILSPTVLSSATVSYLPIGTSVHILPKRQADGRIQLQVLLSISSIIASEIIDGNSYPIATTRQFTASLEIEPGSTLAIGGFDGQNESIGDSGLPLLKRMPTGRHILANTRQYPREKNVMILVTAYDVPDEDVQEQAITHTPPDDGDERLQVPRIRPDGTLVGGTDGVGNAIKWLGREFQPIEQLEKKTDRKYLNRLINAVDVLSAQIRDMTKENPDDAGILEVHQSNLDKIETQMRKIRRQIYRSNPRSDGQDGVGSE